jgi:hypothetical protein
MINRAEFYRQITYAKINNQCPLNQMAIGFTKKILQEVNNCFRTLPQVPETSMAKKIIGLIGNERLKAPYDPNNNNASNDNMIDLERGHGNLESQLQCFLNNRVFEHVHSIFMKIYPNLSDTEIQVIALNGPVDSDSPFYTRAHEHFDRLLLSQKEDLLNLPDKIEQDARKFIASSENKQNI